MEDENPPAPPSELFERCLPCPCNAGSCRLCTSTKSFPGRQFYACPASTQCRFFKWADLVEPHEFIGVPYCGGCMAGVCNFTKVMSGPNAGRILFVCRVKEGQGSCGFRVWQDEIQENASIQSTLIDCQKTAPVNNDKVLGFNLMDDEEPDDAPYLNDTSINMNNDCLDTTFGEMEPSNCQGDKSVDLLRTPSKEYPDRENIGFSPLVHPTSTSEGETFVNSHSFFTPEGNSKLSDSKPTQVAPDTPLSTELSSKTASGNIMTDEISKSFALAAEHLQNDLLTRLEEMDFTEHEAMSHASEASFAAFSHLFHDHQLLKDRVNELIHSAVSLAEIEKSIPDKDSQQRLMDYCCSERAKIEEIDEAHSKVVDTINKNRKNLKHLQKDLCSMKEWIFQAEAELTCCKAEMKVMENQVDDIFNKKQNLKENFLVLSKEWENCLKLTEQKEDEKIAAKAAFDKARALLRS